MANKRTVDPAKASKDDPLLPDIDTILNDFKGGVISAHNNNYGENVWNAEDYAQKQANEAIKSEIIRMLEGLKKEAYTYHGIEHTGGVEVFNNGVDAIPIDTLNELIRRLK